MKTKNLIILVLTLSLPFLLLLLPTGLTKAQSIALGIFLLALFLWMSEAVPLYVTSLIILFYSAAFLTPALKLSGLKISHKVFLAPFFSDIIALFLGGLLLASAVSKYHLDRWLARKVIKISGGQPAKLLLAMMFTTAFLSMWMSNTATTAMMLIITVALVEKLEDNSPFTKAFFLGIPFAANLGGMGTPVGTPPNAIALAEINKSGHAISFGGWMLVALPLVIILILLLWLILINVYKAPKEKIIADSESLISFDRSTIIVILVFILTISLWLTSKIHGLSSGMVALIPAILFLSTGILEKRDFQGISWDVLFLVGGGISLAVGLRLSGLANLLMAQLPLDGLSIMLLLIMFIVIGGVMTTFMSNTATANVIIPLIFIIPGISGSVPLAIGTSLAISATMILPVSTPPNAIAYSSGFIKMGDMVKMGLVVTLLSVFLILTLGMWWWKILGYLN